MRLWTCLRVLVLSVGVSVPGHCQEPPNAWLVDTPSAEADQQLVVGGLEAICLSWSWRDPRPAIELYPDATGGTFLGLHAAWSLDAKSGVSADGPCRSASALPRLGLGPANELWLIATVPEPARSSAWADLLDTLEAVYRQSLPSPLTATTIGSLEQCSLRSLPVPLDTRLDRWSPLELPGRSGPDLTNTTNGHPDPMVRARRFQWWIEPPAPGEDCAQGGSTGTLRLFPIATASEGVGDPGTEEGSDHLLTLTGVEWRHFPHFALDPDDWSPHLRRADPSHYAVETSAIKVRTSPEQRRLLLSTAPENELNLCQIEGLGPLCTRNALARQRLYTATPGQNSEAAWPEERVLETQEACQTVLGPFVPPDGAKADRNACATAALWQRQLPGELVQGFSGEIQVAQQPAIRETWRDGAVEWRLDPGIHPRDLAATPTLEIQLLDGMRVQVETSGLVEGPKRPATSWPWWSLLAGALAVGILATLVLTRRRESLATTRVIETAVDRRQPSEDRPSEEQLRHLVRSLVTEALEEQLADDAHHDGAHHLERTHPHDQRLAEVARDLSEKLQERVSILEEELRGSLRLEAQSLSEGLRQDIGTQATPFRRLCLELDELPENERQLLTATLEAVGQLGDWIERLWPVLQAASGYEVESIARHLPESAAEEWRLAAGALHDFSRTDAVALRRLAGQSAEADSPLDPAETVFMERVFLKTAGLLETERPLAERLKRYLEPFDHLGRLGEVILALQYLVEAYPIEQLARDRRALWRQEMSKAHRSNGHEEDFHHLVAQIAAGVGLRYRPVRYYKSRTDQADFAFVRQQVSPISLSERVGFEATADKEVIVRLERPFFFQLSTDIYFAGHARVARG